MFWKRFFIFIGTVIILAFLAQLIVAPYLKDIIVRKAKDVLGVEVSVGNCALSILKGRIVLEDVNVPSPQYKGEYLIKAKELTVDFYLIPLLFKKQVLQVFSLTQPELILHRDKSGTLQFPQFTKPEGEKQTQKAKSEMLVKRLLIKNGSLKLVDHSVSTPPTVITFSDINCDITNSLSLAERKVLTHIDANGKIKGEGKFSVDIRGNFLSKPRSFNGDIKIENVSLSKFTPYYGENLSIIVKSGSLNVDSKISCVKENLDTPVNVRIENVDVEPIGDPTQTILFELKTSDVIEFLKDENNSAKFSFNITGDLSKPDFKWGSVIQRALREAMLRAFIEGVGRFLQKTAKQVGEKILEKPAEVGEQIGEIIGGEAGEKAKKIGEQLQKILGK